MSTTWESARNLRIGGTDIAAILGCDRFGKDALQVWARLTGRSSPNKPPKGPQLDWGNDLELAVANVYARKTGRRIVAPQDAAASFLAGLPCDVETHRRESGATAVTLVDRTHKWKTGTLDFFVDRYVRTPPSCPSIAPEPRGPGTLSVKTTGRKHADWATGAPLYEFFQEQWYASLAGLEWITFALFAGTFEPLIVRDFAADKNLHGLMHQEVERFMRDNVLGGVAPDHERKGEAYDEALKILFPKDNGLEIVAPFEELGHIDARLREIAQDLPALEREKKDLQRAIKTAMGSATQLRIEGSSTTYTWKAHERAGYTVQPGTVRALRASWDEETDTQ